MSDCFYCRGTGIQYVEPGSSLSYPCPDCDGTGIVPTCDRCGNEYDGEYCDNCYDVCDSCRTIKSVDYDMYDCFICCDCAQAAENARRILFELGVSSYGLSIYDLADICYAAEWEATQYYNQNRPKDFDRKERIDRNIYELAVSDQYRCAHHEAMQCGFCGELGVKVNYIGTEEDADGKFESWNATCTHCGKQSVDVDDPGYAVGIIVRGAKGEVVDAD